jgi:outer membrane usher protein
MDVTEAGKVVVPRSGAGVVVDFSVRRVSDAAIVAFVDAAGKPIPAGTQAVVNGQDGSPALIGYDGEAFIPGLQSHNTAIVMLKDGQTCQASFDFAPVAGQQVNLGEVVCR